MINSKSIHFDHFGTGVYILPRKKILENSSAEHLFLRDLINLLTKSI
jgi:hypothetical protein